MSILRKLSPHAAIVIANMYYVLFAIDRVNEAMNFIDNGYTKFLLFLLCGCAALILPRLLQAEQRRPEDGMTVVRTFLSGLHGLLCGVYLILLIIDLLRGGNVTYVINTRDLNSTEQETDGFILRRAVVENNVTMFTSLDTVRVLLDVLEEITIGVSTIDA